ncbi:hypothetical protein HDU99_009347, partial [Rhizoclosmatium hyalinum]
VVQGNADPSLLYASAEKIESTVKDMLDGFGTSNGYIANLGHGMYPDHDPEHLKAYLTAIKEYSTAKNASTTAGGKKRKTASAQGSPVKSPTKAKNVAHPKMPLRPGTTGRVLPFPASLVRDDVRLDAYVELSTVASLPDLSAPPEPPTPSNPTADLLSPTQQQAQSQTLKPLAPSKPRSRAPSFFVPPLKTKSVSDDSTAPEEVVDEAPAKIVPFPYKLPDLFMNMIRRKRQLEYEAKHPEKLHTRIVVADYSRAVHKKPIALAADISVTEVVPSSSRVSVTSKDGKGGAKWKKKRETTRFVLQVIIVNWNGS